MTDTVVRPMEYLDTEALAQGEREQGVSVFLIKLLKPKQQMKISLILKKY